MSKIPTSRSEKRLREKVNAEAIEILKTMEDRFLSFFATVENPEGEEVPEKVKQISAQWRTYCKRRNLKPEAYTVLDDYMNSTIKEYHKAKGTPAEFKEIVINEAELVPETRIPHDETQPVNA